MSRFPDYSPEFVMKNGKKHYLNKVEKKDFIFGGPLPKLCNIFEHKFCPDVRNELDKNEAKNSCLVKPGCQFISKAGLDKNGPHYCYPEKQKGCKSLTEDDLKREDDELTDHPKVCNRYGVGGIFNRGLGDDTSSPKSNPSCLRGCQGSKFWKNKNFMWGSGGSSKSHFKGSWEFPDLELGPIYLEAAPSKSKPDGWGGEGKLPKSLSETYTKYKGNYSPPCNLNEDVFTDELLAGPGCILTAPDSYNKKWHYTCNCNNSVDSWKPCVSSEIENDRDVCEGCRIQDGNCVLGEKTEDTETEILGCESDNSNSNDCRVKRIINPLQCPSFCSKNSKWLKSTQCHKSLSEEYWLNNPEASKILSKKDIENNKGFPAYIINKNKKEKVDNKFITDLHEDLCKNCRQTPEYHCTVNGVSVDKELSRKIICPPTCKNCIKGIHGEPLDSFYDEEKKNIIYFPWKGKYAIDALIIENTNKGLTF
jgi:hypothetical protein